MKTSKAKKAKQQPPKSKRPLVAAVIVLIVLAGFLFWRFKPATSPKATPVSQAVAAKLKGNWVREDGGYVIEIRGVSNDGKLDSAYFNPNPIHVYRADATQEGTTLKLYLELRDSNYPGSYYTLTYDEKSDQLRGVYYQAVQQQIFDVAFSRKPS
jgi:hypothetical protein